MILNNETKNKQTLIKSHAKKKHLLLVPKMCNGNIFQIYGRQLFAKAMKLNSYLNYIYITHNPNHKSFLTTLMINEKRSDLIALGRERKKYFYCKFSQTNKWNYVWNSKCHL